MPLFSHYQFGILADIDTEVSANGISVSAVAVSASVSATLDIGYIGIGQIMAKVHGYQPKCRHISVKIPVIGQNENIDMLVLIYWHQNWQKYQLGEYIFVHKKTIASDIS
jgi:hypothetical protein